MAIPQIIEELAHKIRTAIYGKDVRESLASGIEKAGEIAEDARKKSDETDSRQTELETRFEQQIQNMTLEDPSSAEIVDARGGETLLRHRLDKVDAHLAQTETDLVSRGINIMFPPPPLIGAKPDGTDQTSVIQNIINYVEDNTTINTPDWANMHSPTIFIPEGIFIVSGLIVTKPINFVGASNVTSVIKSNGEDVPIFTVKGHLKSSTGVEDIKTTFYRLAIVGSEPQGYDNPFTKTNQIGIKVDNSDTDNRHRARVEVHFCNIRHCGSHGIYLETSVSNKITHTNITLNSGDGIHMTGQFVTDTRVLNCSIRRNRIGINVSPSAGNFITTGLISGNTIESNRNGSGTAGSSTRPAVGIRLLRTQFLTIRDNYFERHLNDIYIESDASFNRIENNYFDASSNIIPGYEGYAPIERQVCAIFFDGSNNFSNTIEKNRLYKPNKPESISDEDWGTSRWGRTYEHLPAMNGASYTQIIRNYARDEITTGQLEEILYSGSDNQFYEGINREATYHAQQTRTQHLRRKASIAIFDHARSHTFESETTNSTEIPRNIHIHPSLITNVFKRFFSSRERNADGSLGTLHDAFGINLNGEFAIPLGKPIAMQYAEGNYFARQYVGTAPPTSGTYGRGDIMWNRNPSAGGFMGWTCVAAGSPGTWKGFGRIES